jgi:hypothetical protein
MYPASGAEVQERRTMMIPSTPWPPTHTEYDQAESETTQADIEYEERERHLQDLTPLDAPVHDVNLEYIQWQRKRDFNASVRGFSRGDWIAIFLFIMGILVLLILTHPMW